MADNRESEMGSAEVAKRMAVLQSHLIIFGDRFVRALAA